MKSFKVPTPPDFNYRLNLDFLKRSPKELLHKIDGDSVYKALRSSEKRYLLKISPQKQGLRVSVLNAEPSRDDVAYLRKYVTEWFDLETDLDPFYQLAKRDQLLAPLVKQFYGYRIIGQPDLFESLVWAIIGQQINLSFAYSIKSRFVEKFGERIPFNNESYYLFPTPAIVAGLSHEILSTLQFSKQKSDYVTGVARAFVSGQVSKEKLHGLPLKDAREHLMTIKGIGNWTANYALMKTFRYPDAFPLEDAGIHNAIKNLKKLNQKPTLETVRRIFKKYKGWEAYATIYLWKSL